MRTPIPPTGPIPQKMATLMQSQDWASTPLGPPDAWPQSLRTVVNILLTSRYAMWMGWGDSLTFLYNDAYQPTLGIKHPWALGKPAGEVWQEIWHEIGPRIEAVLSTGEATYDEGLLLFLERSGFPEETYHTFSYSPLSDDAGRTAGMLCVVTEETERVINERRMGTLRDLAAGLAAAVSEAELMEVVERELAANPQDLLFTLTYLYEENGDAVLARATHMPGAPPRIAAGSDAPWPAHAMLAQPMARLLHSLEGPLPTGAWDKPSTQAAMVPIKQQGLDRPAGFLVIGLNPYQRYGEAYSGFVDLVAGQVAAGLANARAYEVERQRAEALAELDRAKTTFFSNVSHEFRTPLTLMLGPVEDLLASPDVFSDEASRDLLQVVQRSGLRLQRLVNTLLDFSRIEAGRALASYQQTDLGTFTAELASGFESAMQRAGLAFSVECNPLDKPVYVDREMWEKIVLNLVSNAFKYTLSGRVTVTVEESAGNAVLTVTDTGPGIPSSELPRLFERFHRIAQTRGRTHEGSGIGLALVQELVKLNGGTVSVESEPGRGSAFRVALPFGTAHLAAERISKEVSSAASALHAGAFVDEAIRWLPDTEQPVRAALPGLTKGRVLLADDNADMREYVRRLLSAEYEVETAANGEEALAMALANPPDVILSDVMMPVLDGFGLLRALRAQSATHGVPVILLSARAGEEASVEGLQAGADDYLVKPFSARELLARVGTHIALRRERQQALCRMNQIFSQAPVGIVVLRGRDFVIELANPLYQALLEGRELVGRRMFEVIPELAQNVRDAFNSVLDTGKPFVAHEWLVPYDNDRDGVPEDHWFNVVYHPLQEAGGEVTGIIAVTTEVTVQVLARQELERANRELEEFAYVASHDLQEPLRMVNIYTQLLMKRVGSPDAEMQEYARIVRQGVRRMEALIKDLLIYSRVVHPEQEEPEPASLDEALDEALDVLRMRMEESGATVERNPLPTVLGDCGQLALVFQNLISNALKYCQAGVAPRIRITAEQRGERWVVRIEDNGIGFDPQHAERIFGLFKRLHKDAYPGTGLGLAICKRIVERYEGRIWAGSAGGGQGAVFSFSLRQAETNPPDPHLLR